MKYYFNFIFFQFKEHWNRKFTSNTDLRKKDFWSEEKLSYHSGFWKKVNNKKYNSMLLQALKNENGKKNINQLLGAHSTRKLVEIHNLFCFNVCDINIWLSTLHWRLRLILKLDFWILVLTIFRFCLSIPPPLFLKEENNTTILFCGIHDFCGSFAKERHKQKNKQNWTKDKRKI